MNNLLKFSIDYFSSPKNYFWQWAENAEVIEWKNGMTICYRDELLQIMDGLQNEGMPSLSAVLLILSACQNKWKKSEKKALLNEILISTGKTASSEKELNDVLNLLDLISNLPAELRSGNNKINLICEIFKNNNLIIEPEKVRIIKDELGSGRLDNFIKRFSNEIKLEQFINHLIEIKTALERFKNSESLELLLKTGVEKIPEKVEIDFQEKDKTGLLEQLEEDEKTSSLTQLTRRLIAAIDLPIHSRGSSEQTFGGISDITNRGNFDKLLLSELAQDDLLLMARLVNNEALYFRREEPPASPLHSRTILIDTTIKMWGVPRIFAICAGLACSENNKNNVPVKAYALGKDSYQETDLSSKDGVISLLQYLDTGLNCCEAIKEFINNNKNNSADNILITDEAILKTAEYQAIAADVKNSFSFLITVNRSGELNFYEFLKERMKLLSTSRFDLDELLFYSSAKSKNTVLPAFMDQEQNPLYSPTPSLKLSDRNVYYNEELGVIAVTEQQIVLYWRKKEKGAIELNNFIEFGEYYFHYTADNKTAYILVSCAGDNLLKLYKFNITDLTFESINLIKEINSIVVAHFNENDLYLKTNLELITIDLTSNKIYERKDSPEKYTIPFLHQNISYIKRFIYNGGYNILKRVRSIFINDSGQISLDKYSISLKNGGVNLEKNDITDFENFKESELIYLLDNDKVKFHKHVWQDGSQAILDSRGFLHLKSSDDSIPEITILIVVGKIKNLTCWSSDDTVCGSPYFYKVMKYKTISEDQFYKNNIQRFIDKLIY